MLVTVAGLGAWWVTSQLDWIQYRREFLKNNHCWDGSARNMAYHPRPRAPFGLWVFGEEGVEVLCMERPVSEADEDTAKRLFPEAKIELTTWTR